MKNGKEKRSFFSERTAHTLFRAMYFYITGHLLLLMSAIAEKGRTELSRVLIPKAYMAEEMLESVIAAMTVLGAGWLLLTYCFEKEKNDR